MINVWLLYHSTHGMLNRSIGKFVVSMLFPDVLEIKVRPSDFGLKKLEISSVRNRLHVVVEVLMEWCCKSVALSFGVIVHGPR